MRGFSPGMPEQGTQAPSPAPDLIPAETENQLGNSHRDWYSKPGHFRSKNFFRRLITLLQAQGNDSVSCFAANLSENTRPVFVLEGC